MSYISWIAAVVQLVDWGGSCIAPIAYILVQLVGCGSWIAEAAIHEQIMDCGCRSSPGWVEFSLPQCRNRSPFIPSQKNVKICFSEIAETEAEDEA